MTSAPDDPNVTPDPAHSDRRVFAVLGLRPEPGGYAIAKFSRSARPYEEWAQELTQEGAERFYEQFYFQYGHASIADLAHLTMVVENISIVAAIEVLDEPLVDAQESSTRYQDYTQRRYYTPPELRQSPLAERYRTTCDALFEAYKSIHEAVTDYYLERYAKERPPDLGDAAYRRTLRARAFDVARYLLPASTFTGLGYLVSARTLERQIVRLLSDPGAEVREVGEALRAAATSQPAFNPLRERIDGFLATLQTETHWSGIEDFVSVLGDAGLSLTPAAPTLVKYTAPSAYTERLRRDLTSLATELLGDTVPDQTRGVELFGPHDQQIELAATLLYRASACSYRQVLAKVETLSASERQEIVDLVYRHRGPHDPPPRETRTGYSLTFDICMDCGAFRDLHRHRNCVQIVQPFWGVHGYDTPSDLETAGVKAPYVDAMDRAGAARETIGVDGPHVGQYVLPLGYRRRALFKMDAAELAYIAEVRTRPAGHFSYRHVAHAMYEEFARLYPGLAKHIRVTDPAEEDFFER
jgi:thymidylate synthase ThyX